ncbi:autotransporter-associated beta strand protein [Actinoplanes lutulentus]|uniref:Autotransporter-associated beta strand protein n=1 Tax=Actinoplanes lutulentus TaxID=1287878 RepID=A0A327ZIK3_9ACTN|nr:phosphatase PAP2 family protein [Actinoplanes lutulentus]MBB2944258.1 autotransporter-associated beta strand protein [Actinoplanes lutulentus]RAK42509.1 autotransporter-associated beta strand protein [Actinoplanes lutulentus]
MNLSRRTLLRASAAGTAGLLAGPQLLSTSATAATAPTATATAAAFVDSYQTNITANLTAETNAAVRILTGMNQVWSTGTAWNTGTVLDHAFLRANVRYCVKTTHERTEAEAARAFVVDRQHQSYSVIAGLGPLADVYKAGALAVTGITSAPATTPATTISDAVPAGAPAGSALGAGSTSSALGKVVTLVNTLRGNYSSGNPSKFSYQYPRPWRMNADSEIVPTGEVDAFGYPVYESDTIVVPQLLRQRSTNPAEDGGYVSGHTNALYLASIALAYAVPERFQEMITAAYDLAETRIIAGMHSPADVIGGRILGTALAAAILGDAANATLKAEARAQALAYFQAQVGGDLFAYAHSSITSDGYADRARNAAIVKPKQTYGLPRTRNRAAFTVPKGAEVLLETRLPYLDAAQRREVLRTTGLAAGNPLLDGGEQWGRLDLFTAADGYAAFDATVAVSLDATAGGFSAADTWRNDIEGRGGLIKLGTGELTLAGDNEYQGGTTIAEGTVVAAAKNALGSGDVTVTGGTLRLAAEKVHVGGELRLRAGTLAATVRPHGAAPLTVHEEATIGAGTVLEIAVTADKKFDKAVPVLKARKIRGRFAKVVVTTPGYQAELIHQNDTVTVRLRKA